MVPTPTGKYGKMGEHFRVSEKSLNFEQTGKVRGFYTTNEKIWKFRQFFSVIFEIWTIFFVCEF